LWLILTPFLMLQPFVRDAWRVALHRNLGSVAGVIMVVLLAPSLSKELPLQLPAIVLCITTVLIAIRHGHPALMMALTATIVLFNSDSGDLIGVADQRLQANAIGVGISLGIRPIEQRQIRSSS
jgi:uncharacterized membrane protein YccC